MAMLHPQNATVQQPVACNYTDYGFTLYAVKDAANQSCGLVQGDETTQCMP